MQQAKRLIEVDLPIKRISAHARSEKSVRFGHISNLHIWWARRPLAACRAVLCATLWPDPADPLCPQEFIITAKEEMLKWAKNDRIGLLSRESTIHFIKLNHEKTIIDDKQFLRALLLDFIADFSDWEKSVNKVYLETCHILTASAHQALGGEKGTKPIIVDPFAGGGAFPIEAARIGADSFAGDLNALAISLNKILLEYAPRYGTRLTGLVKQYGEQFKSQLKDELKLLYPPDQNGNCVLYYFWARTIRCEGPNCGLEVPIVRSLQFSKKKGNEASVSFYYKDKKLKSQVHIGNQANTAKGGTSKRSSVTCPDCGFTTARKHVQTQANEKGFGYYQYCVCTKSGDGKFRIYRDPTPEDLKIIEDANKSYSAIVNSKIEDTELDQLPDEELPYLRSIFNVRVYGIDKWHKLYTNRQLVSATKHIQLFRNLSREILKTEDKGLATAIIKCLSLSISNSFQYQCNIATYLSEHVVSAFIQGQSLGMKMDFVESNPLMPSLVGGYEYSLNKLLSGLEYLTSFDYSPGQAIPASALTPFLPEDSVDLVATDPPYYDVIPYADCSDFFYVWLKRMYQGIVDSPFKEKLSRKDEEIVQLAERNEKYKERTKQWFENKMAEALYKWRISTKANGKALIVFAHKETKAWEALLKAVLDAGWVITASWPIDTENSARMRANESAVLSTSIHLVCEPLEHSNENSAKKSIGDWRKILKELPVKIHEWMPRLAKEGVVGADAIFACLGPALEVFSKYSSVEKTNGDVVPLKDYLEQVWAAVSQEALSMVVHGTDAKLFEEDARLTAMWLWTVAAPTNETTTKVDLEEDYVDEIEEESAPYSKLGSGFILEYDTVRLISQGLGANLADLTSIVEIKGDKARLLPVAERTSYLFGSEELKRPTTKKKKKIQSALFEEELEKVEVAIESSKFKINGAAKTVLDRVHQAMLLFAMERTEALKRFLVEDGIGRDERFWKLAQALTALYPKDSDERRWVEAVQTYKKSLGF